MGRITVFGGPERRRRWSVEEQRRILEEAFAPGACVAQVARRHDVSTALVYTWRRKLGATLVASQEDHGFVEAVVLEESSSVPTPGQPAIIVELSHGARVSIYNSASATLAQTVVKALAR
ncbi:IS66-like element accessory protein TnpA [Novosphingobium sp. NPDC080210]|uniref:IS66-like element accessory protein TnpA n=1 Tax=Novosphingobium sp. NPDC080210 TaxID=3390596 RepID=UPI003CFFB9AB